MKRDMFTTATIEAALNNLKEYGAIIPKETAAFAKEKKAVIIGKFTPSPNCFDGYCIRKTTKAGIEMLRKEYPNRDARLFKYCVIFCIGCKDDYELMKGLGFWIKED